MFLGIDGGGTSTEYLLLDGDANPISQFTGDTIDVNQIGVDGFRNNLQIAKQQLLKNLDSQFITGACVGIPNFGETELSPELEVIVKEVYGENSEAVNDVYVAWAGSLACRYGIHVVAGTGSIAFGKDDKGNTGRCGGWSTLFSDEGSAYWLGIKLLELFSKQSDGRIQKGPLYEIVRREFGIENDLEIIQYSEDHFAHNRRQLASLQMLLHECALAGDISAQNAYAAAAKELASLVIALYTRLDFPMHEKTKISCSGGMFKDDSLIRDPFIACLEGINVITVTPELKPVEGAGLLALLNDSKNADEMLSLWVNKLKNSSL